MITQEDTIFVSGMNTQASEDDIAAHFGAIGIIKVCYLPKSVHLFGYCFYTYFAYFAERQKNYEAKGLAV